MIYSNTNYVLLQLILEAVSGMSYEKYFELEIIEPFNLLNTSLSTINPYPDGLTTGYCDMYDNERLREVSQFDANRWSGEAALISNSHDIFRFYDAFNNGQLVSFSTLQVMRENHFGLFEDIFNGNDAYGHDGLAVGYSSEMWFFPEKELTVVLISNQGRVSADQPSIQGFERLFEAVIKLH